MSKKTASDLVIWLLAFVLTVVVAWQALDYFHFRQAGERFTAAHGQEVCLRVRALERGLGLPAADCRYKTEEP
jgi:hypothetical protein